MMKNQKGITLIALVITIIVLLILAGVSIAMLTGENGILTKASGANEKSTAAEVEEAIKLAISEILANKLDPTYTGNENVINDTSMKAKIESNNANIKDGKIEITVTAATAPETGVTVTYEGTTGSTKTTHTWAVDKDGKIEKISPVTPTTPEGTGE